jgi:hypothetical protein
MRCARNATGAKASRGAYGLPSRLDGLPLLISRCPLVNESGDGCCGARVVEPVPTNHCYANR